MTDHVFTDPVEATVKLSYEGKLFAIQVACDGDERRRLVAKLSLVSLLAGPGQKVRLGGRRPDVP